MTEPLRQHGGTGGGSDDPLAPRPNRLFRERYLPVNPAFTAWGEDGRMNGWGLAGAIASGFLLTATAAGASPAAAQSRLAARGDPSLPCRPGFTTIRMTALASGHHSVAIVLNGKPGLFLIDTGAGATIIHAPYLAKFALAPAAAAGIAANGGGEARYAPVPISALTVGGARTRLHKIYAMDLSYLVDAVSASSAQPIDGLIGQDVLRDQKAMIDFDQSVLYLAFAGPAPGASCRPSGPAIASARSAP